MGIQKLKILIITTIVMTELLSFGQSDSVKLESLISTRYFNERDGITDTVTIYKIKNSSIEITENKYEFQSIENNEHKFYYSKNTPRLILYNTQLLSNNVTLASTGSIRTFVSTPLRAYKTPSTYGYSGWQNKGHLIYDIYNGELVYHDSNFLALNKKEPTRIYPTSIKGLDIVISAKLDGCNNERNFPKPGSYLWRGGYLVEAFNNRKTLDGYKITITNDSLPPHELIEECWYDFHIDKKGVTHAFVYLRGELIYLNQMNPSHDQLAPTSWKEIFSVPASEDIGPFTSVTVKGKQYLFTQDGTILKNTGMTMTEVGKLPGDLRNTSVVWDKEKDKMWYITKQEFDAYKAGDASIIKRMHEIHIDRR